MSNIQVNYTGDGATVLYTITFDYLRRAHVKASINGSNTIDFTFANDTTLQFNSAPANGAAISLFRETSADAVDNTFFPNSSISSESLNDNFLQTLLVSEEAREIAAEAQLGNLVPGSIGTAALTDGAVTSVKIANNTIVNEDINASAAIADTKLATIATAGKVSNSATTATSSNTVSAIVARDASGNFTAGTITADLTGTASAIADNIVTSAKIVNGTIVDADVNASAAITGTKISPDFGSQNVVTTGTATAASLNPTGSSVPTDGVYRPAANSIAIATNGVERLRFGAAGQIGIGGATYGSAGQVLISNGAATAPAWQTLEAFTAGTVMLFQQTSAPTGWTKITTHNNKALRVVSGSAGSGGATAFTSVFASRTPAGSVSGSVSGSNSGGGVNGHTLSTHEMPSHSHQISFSGTDGAQSRSRSGAGETGTFDSAAAGGNGSQAHGFTPPSWSGSFSGSFSGSAMDFNVQYVDVIFASKN